MKKFFTLIAATLMAVGLSAQRISFEAGQNPADGFSNGDFKITVTDTDGKLSCDANNAYFGTADSPEKFTARLKSGGKSSSKNFLTVTVPADGALKVYVRTGSNSATDRTLVLTQNGAELFNQVVKEADAVKVTGLDETDPTKETNVYPIISISVKAGDVDVTYPVGSMNFYAFEFAAGESGGNDQPEETKDPTAATIWNFTANLGDTDIANLAGDRANWEYSDDKGYWYNTATLSEKNVFTTLKANGAELELTKGIEFTRNGGSGLEAERVRIAPAKYVAVNGSNIIIKLADLAKDDVVKIRLKGAGDSERSLTPTNAELTDGTLTTADTEVHEAALKVLANGALTLTTSNGFQFLALTINANLPENGDDSDGIKTVSAERNATVVYNLAGQQVSNHFKGIAIQNGKKVVLK